MEYKAALLALVLVSGSLAGCTGDPDAGGNDEIDLVLLQEFLNNTTLTMPKTLHSMSGTLDGDGFIPGPDNATPNCIWYYGATKVWWDYCNVISMDVNQPEGVAVSIQYLLAYVNLIGQDTTNDSSENDYAEQQYGGSGDARDAYAWVETDCYNGFSSNVWITYYGTMLLSQSHFLAGAGLECTHTFYFGAYAPAGEFIGDVKYANEFDELDWSDWTYSIIWEQHAVTVEN
jgi:hypothetical protein